MRWGWPVVRQHTQALSSRVRTPVFFSTFWMIDKSSVSEPTTRTMSSTCSCIPAPALKGLMTRAGRRPVVSEVGALLEADVLVESTAPCWLLVGSTTMAAGGEAGWPPNGVVGPVNC